MRNQVGQRSDPSLLKKPGARSPARTTCDGLSIGPALAPGTELCTDWPEVSAAVGGQYRQRLAGLGTHPPAGS